MKLTICIAILLSVSYTSAKLTATFDELLHDFINDVIDNNRIEKLDVSPKVECKTKCSEMPIELCKKHTNFCSKYRASNPVCGSDGITYDSQCMMKLFKCKQNPIITMAHVGECKQE